MLSRNFSSFKEIFLRCLSFFLELKKPTSDFSHFYWVYFLFIWKRSRQKLVKTGKKKMVLLAGLSIMDLVVAGISLVIGLGIFVFIASILCSAAFLHNAKHVSWFIFQPSIGNIPLSLYLSVHALGFSFYQFFWVFSPSLIVFILDC